MDAQFKVGQVVFIDCHNLEESSLNRVWRKARIVGLHRFDQYEKATLAILDGPCKREEVVRGLDDLHLTEPTECSICRREHGLEVQHACE